MRVPTTIAALLALLAAALPASAEPLRWKDVVRRANELPGVKAASARAKAANARIRLAGQVANPVVEGTVARGAPDGAAAGLEWGVAARVPFDWLARRGPETDAARAEAEAARSGTSIARREVLARVAERFWAVAHGDATVGALAEAERHAAGLAAAVRLRVEAGEARPSELPRVETDLARTSIELDKARSRLRADRHALEAVLGLPATADGIVIAASIDADPPLPAREAAFAAATQSHPALAAARSRARAGVENVAAQKARRIPAFSVGGFYDSEIDKSVAGGVLSVELPLWNTNAGGIAEAKAGHAALEAEAAATERELAARFETAWEACAQARGAAGRIAREVVPRAVEAADGVEKAYRAGETSLLDVLDARRNAVQSRRELLDARLLARTECIGLAALTGDIERGE